MQFPIGIAFALGITLVVFLLALAQCNLALDQVLAPIPGQADAGIALLLYGSGELVEFAGIEQQFARAHRVGNHMGARGG